MTLGFYCKKDNITLLLNVGVMLMLLTIDVGNSDIVTILYDENKEVLNFDRRKTIKKDCSKGYLEYVWAIKKLFNIDKVNYIVSCVVPSIQTSLKNALEKEFMVKGDFIDYQSYPGISKLLNPPQDIGADLVASSVEVIKGYNQPAIIIDMGTATKVIVVDDNTIVGVAIMLGVEKTANAIVSSMPHLPKVDLKFPSNIVGQNTIESIQSGIMISTVAAINGYTKLIEQYFNKKVAKVITGGISTLFIGELEDFTYNANLVNEGLYTIYYNKEF